MRRTYARSGRVTGTADLPPARRTVAVLGAGAAGLALVATLSGCGAGQISETSVVQPAVQGYSVDAGTIQVRDATLDFPASGNAWPVGSDVPLVMRIINSGRSADRLLGASSDQAASVVLHTGGASGSPTASAPASPAATSPAATSPAAMSASASPSKPATSSAAKSSASPSPAASAFPLTLAPVTVVTLDPSAAQLVLTGVREKLDAAKVVTVTLQFEHAGTVTLELPVGPPTTPLPRTSLTHADEG